MDNLVKIEENEKEDMGLEFLEQKNYQPKNWKDRLAFIISGILSPFFLGPIFISIIIFTYSKSTVEFLTYFFTASFFSILIPFLNVYLDVKRGKITDIHVAVRQERTKPFLVGMLSILIGTFALHLLKAPKEVVVCGLVVFIISLIYFLITLYWKISIHSSALAIFIVTLVIMVNKNFAYGFFLIPLLIWARIRRKRHNIYQGLIATFLSVLASLLLFKAFGIIK